MSQPQQQLQQQLQMQKNILNQQGSQIHSQLTSLASQQLQNGHSQFVAPNETPNSYLTQSQSNSTPYLSNYYFGSPINGINSTNQQLFQHQQMQQQQNNYNIYQTAQKQLGNGNNNSTQKPLFIQQSTSYTNNSINLDNSLQQKQNTSLNTNSISHSTQQQQSQQPQQQTALSPQQTQLGQQSFSMPQSPLISPQIQQTEVKAADITHSSNSQIKKKKIFINTNNNFYLSASNTTSFKTEGGGSYSTHSSSTNSQKGYNLSSNNSAQNNNNLNRKNQQKPQRTPLIQPQSLLTNQSGLIQLSNNTSPSGNGGVFLNNSVNICSSNNNGSCGSLNLQNQNNSMNTNTNQSTFSDEQRFIKKTQHFIRGLTSLSGTWNGNNQEEICDLDQSVIEMMKECNLYEQAQKGVIPDADPTKLSVKSNGLVSCYSAKTHQGLVRNYNEDRVSIILNILKPQNRQNDEQWPKCSFFGVYDGHGGVNCADFLRDHLHQYVIKDPNFPWNPKEAIKNGFEQAELQFLKQAQAQINRGGQVDRSGSCALVVLIVVSYINKQLKLGDICYVANVGDSRAVISQDAGKQISALTRDHKPMDEVENFRIHENGGKVYQTKIQSITVTDKNDEDPQVIVGPYRVLPGRLSVTRTFGDIEAKFSRYGGNPKVVISSPEIKSFKIQPNHDFIVIGCDGIYDKITSQEIGQIVWETSKNENIGESVHEFSSKAAENIMKLSIARKTLDNITIVVIGFNNLERILFDKVSQQPAIQLQSTANLQTTSSISNQLSSSITSIAHKSNELYQQQQQQQQSQNSIASPSNQKQSLINSLKNQKLLQNISQQGSISQSQIQYGLNQKYGGSQPQSTVVEKHKMTQVSYNSFSTDKGSKVSIVPLSEKDSNLQSPHSKLSQQSQASTLGMGARLSFTKPIQKKLTENSQDNLKQSQADGMNRSVNLSRPSKVGLEYHNNSQTSQISLYSSSQLSTKQQFKQQGLASPTQVSNPKGIGSSTSEPKFYPNSIKSIQTK